jgi:hypothetical protein
MATFDGCGRLGYTPMTLSRVVKELTAAGLAAAYTVGRSRWLRMEQPPQQTWEQAKPLLRTPVKRTVWVLDEEPMAKQLGRLAGLSALAHYSMLTEPRWPVYALSATEWKAASDAGLQELPEPVAGAREWQLWSYSPALLPGAATVDPLSLTLSLQDNADDRIQLAGRTERATAMVRGLDVFQGWFADYADQYVLIGGTAASLTMEEAGLAFRAAKDLDIVLHVEGADRNLWPGLLEVCRRRRIRDSPSQRYGKTDLLSIPSLLMTATRRWSNCSREHPTDCSRPKAVDSHRYRWTKPSPACPPSCWTSLITHSSWLDA